MRMRRLVIIGSVAGGALALTGCVSGPPDPAQVAEEFAASIEPAWQVEVPGLYGEPVLRDGIVYAYADDEEVGMRLTAHSLEDGELLWEHTSSPGGAYANPLLTSQDAASRPYPIATIAPLVVDRGEGEDAARVVVFFERDIPEEGSIRPDDLLRVADARTGELLDLTVPDFDRDELTFEPVGVNSDGEVFANALSPAYPCGEGELCWIAEDPEAVGAYGLIALDPQSLAARFEGGHVPAIDETVSPEWGLDFARISGEGIDVARFDDGRLLWRAGSDALFGVERSSPPDFVDFTRVGDLVLIQGYQSILETLDPDLPHTLELDFVTSRTLVAVDAESGEVVWRLPGGDMLCHAVHERPIPADAESIPICLASEGSFVFDYESGEMLEQEQLVASIAQVSLADGEVGWQTADAGTVSIAHVGRLLDITYAARGDYAVADAETETGLVDLRDGEWYPAPEDAGFVCKAERPDVDLEFEGSAFAGGSNPITTGYPAGWYHFPCDGEGAESDTWTKGAVRVAGYRDAGADSRLVVLPLEDSLVAFDLG